MPQFSQNFEAFLRSSTVPTLQNPNKSANINVGQCNIGVTDIYVHFYSNFYGVKVRSVKYCTCNMHAMVNDFCQLNGQDRYMYSKYSVMFARYYRVSFTSSAMRVWGQNLVVQAVQVHRI